MRIGYVYPEAPCWIFFYYHLMVKSAHLNVQIVARQVNTLDDQIAELESLLRESIDVLMFRPLASGNSELLATVGRANRLGIPIIALDGSVGGEGDGDGDTDITTVSVDNEEGKARITDYICRRLNGRGKIAHIQGNQDMETGRTRTRGMHRALERYPNIVLAYEQSLDWGSPVPLRIQGQELARVALTAHPELNAFITTSDESAFGVADVLEALNLQSQVLVTGFDALPEALIAIADGRIEASVQQPLELMAEQALNDAMRLTSQACGPVTHTRLPAETITKDNLTEQTVSALRLFPDVIRELNRRREEQSSNAKFLDTLIDNFPHILVVKDAERLTYVRTNRAANDLLGIDPTTLIGKTAFEIFPPETAHRIDESDRQVLANGRALASSDALTYQQRLGVRQMHSRRVPIFDSHGKPAFLLTMIQDVTEQKNAEAKLEEYSRALEIANVTLHENREKLIATEKMAALGSLVAGVAHELNTPIGNGLMAVSTLIDQTHAVADRFPTGMTHSLLDRYLAEAASGAEILTRNLRRAANLIVSFKQIAVDQSSSQARRFSLATLVSEVLLTLMPTLKKTVFTIQQTVPDDIQMDSYPGPLEQVLINLINNAVIHGLAGRETGQVAIAASTPRPGWVELTIQDDGVGIDDDQIGRIFDPFFTTRSEAGGTGLGLSISHNIVTGLLGGEIEVSSAVGRGTRFSLTLPLRPGN